MRALILQDDDAAAVSSSRALIDKGFQILCVKNRDVAETLIRMDKIDLLVMDEQVDGCLTHAIALSGERKNPFISSIIVTDRSKEETDDLYELIPSLYALVGNNTAPDLMGQLAHSSVTNLDALRERVRRQRAADLADANAPDDLVPDDLVIERPQAAVARPQISEAPAPVSAAVSEPVSIPAPSRAPVPAPVQTVEPAQVAATIAPTPAPAPVQVSVVADDINIPTYSDVVFSTPALAELAQTDYFDTDQDEKVEESGPFLTEFDKAPAAARQPLVLTGAISQGVPA